ncbi:MAG: tripartite tricarboxylate transporter substrate binding protein [Bacillota bacterium]
MSKRFVTITVAILAVMMLAAAVPGGAAAWPTKPIEVIIPYAPGGGSDVTSRIFAKYFEKELGQPVVIVNIEGAQGKIGEMEVLNARPDGYKILWQHHVLHCLYLTGVTNHTWKDFTPIAVGAKSDNVVIVGKDSPWNSLADVIRDAKAKPGQYVMEFAPGTTNHFGVLQLLSEMGVTMNMVPKSGDNPRITSILGGHCDITVVAMNSAMPFYNSGDIKILGVMSTERSQWLPEVPTVIEQGINAELLNEYVLYAPKGIPADVEETLRSAFKKVMTSPELIAEYEAIATAANFMDKEETLERLENIFNTYEALAKEFDIYRK